MKKGEKSESSGINSTTDLSFGVVIVSFIHLLGKLVLISYLHYVIFFSNIIPFFSQMKYDFYSFSPYALILESFGFNLLNKIIVSNVNLVFIISHLPMLWVGSLLNYSCLVFF